MLIPVFRAGSRKARKLLHFDAAVAKSRAVARQADRTAFTPAAFLFRHHNGLGSYNLHGPPDPRMRFFWSPTLIVTVRE